MNSKDLFLALGKISDDLIEGATPKKAAFYKKSAFKWAVAIVACLCIIIVGVSFKLTRDTPLPKLNSTNIDFGAMGYEGTDELSLKSSNDINPWNESLTIETLPVYKNLCYNSGKLYQNYFTEAELKEQAETICEILSLSYTPKEKEEGNIEGVSNFSLDTDAGTLSVFPKGSSIRITNGDYSLVSKHMELLFGKVSDNEIVSGDYYTYSVDGELLGKETRSYLKGKSIKEDIVNFNFSSHYLTKIDSETTSLNSSYLNGCESLGEYPIKSADKAREDLLSGKYVPTVALDYVNGQKLTKDVIVKVDLIYYTDGNPKLYLPYYRFYIECYSVNDISQYAYFYVCAIEDEYIDFHDGYNGDYQ